MISVNDLKNQGLLKTEDIGGRNKFGRTCVANQRELEVGSLEER